MGKNNVEVLVELMEHSKYGALAQAFIIDSVLKVAEAVLEADEGFMGDSALVSREAWAGVAAEVNSRLREHLYAESLDWGVELVPVESSHIVAVGYDSRAGALIVQFRNLDVYAYFGVPKRLFEGLIAAESVGKYLNEHIKKVFGYKKLSATK